MSATLGAQAREELEAELMKLQGVLHAALDPRSGTDLWVVRDPDFEQGPIEIAVRNRLSSLGHPTKGLEIHVALAVPPGPRRRVRFDEVRREERGGQVAITVSLEWDGVAYSGEAVGERGGAIELKTTARAAIKALEKLSGESLDVRVTGVKAIHAFDTDLMVASLYRSAGEEQRLVGAVVVTEDPQSAAAVAVLSALNRTLGNFLHASD